jgi:hypothetical protein
MIRRLISEKSIDGASLGTAFVLYTYQSLVAVQTEYRRLSFEVLNKKVKTISLPLVFETWVLLYFLLLACPT